MVRKRRRRSEEEAFFRFLLEREGYTLSAAANLAGVRNYQTIQYFMRSFQKNHPPRNRECLKAYHFFQRLAARYETEKLRNPFRKRKTA